MGQGKKVFQQLSREFSRGGICCAVPANAPEIMLDVIKMGMLQK